MIAIDNILDLHHYVKLHQLGSQKACHSLLHIARVIWEQLPGKAIEISIPEAPGDIMIELEMPHGTTGRVDIDAEGYMEVIMCTRGESLAWDTMQFIDKEMGYA
jgi:hypothetical protein